MFENERGHRQPFKGADLSSWIIFYYPFYCPAFLYVKLHLLRSQDVPQYSSAFHASSPVSSISCPCSCFTEAEKHEQNEKVAWNTNPQLSPQHISKLHGGREHCHRPAQSALHLTGKGGLRLHLAQRTGFVALTSRQRAVERKGSAFTQYL